LRNPVQRSGSSQSSVGQDTGRHCPVPSNLSHRRGCCSDLPNTPPGRSRLPAPGWAPASRWARPGSLDNAVIESWHSTLEWELRRVQHFATKAPARAKVAAWIEDYNTTRRHSSLGMLSPHHLRASAGSRKGGLTMSPLPRHQGCAGARPSPGRSSPGPDGPAGAPPGQDLRSGGYMAANEAGHTSKIISNQSVHAFRRTPTGHRESSGLALAHYCRVFSGKTRAAVLLAERGTRCG
jgi:hypothetical protein